MAAIDTRSTRLGAVLQYEDHPEYGHCRKVVTANEAAIKTYAIGTVLGQVTANGKYKILEATAVDGSQNFAGIYIGKPDGDNKQTIAATTDTSVTILFRGPAGVGKSYLVFGASVDTAPELAAVYAQMEAVGIQVLDQPNQFV
jgi:hypothetical protein